ncbi:hypothetical protein EV183_000924 [Coemansia sp. RSA 2336]|nr:hypothetical protein EV183_000924 [Coemansia sp. RSA 2336]
MRLCGLIVLFGVPALGRAASSAPTNLAQGTASELEMLDSEQADRAQYGTPTWGPATRPPVFQSNLYGQSVKEETTSSSSSSSYDYSYAVAFSGFDGSITHYYVSYSDPYVSGAVGVGHVDPTPTPTQIITEGTVCDKTFPGLLSGIGLDLGLRLNLSLIGVDACVAL